MKRSDGYIALLAVLVLGAAATAIATMLLITGADAQRTNLIVQRTIQARQLANGCVEEALQKLHDSSSYVGTDTLSLDGNTCSYTVANTGGANRSITVNSTVGNVVRKVTTYVTIGSSSISVTSWQEVS